MNKVQLEQVQLQNSVVIHGQAFNSRIVDEDNDKVKSIHATDLGIHVVLKNREGGYHPECIFPWHFVKYCITWDAKKEAVKEAEKLEELEAKPKKLSMPKKRKAPLTLPP